MSETRWGIFGPGAIAHNFADGLKEAPSGRLVAIASRSEERRRTFGDDYALTADKRYFDYAALATDPDVDAIYVCTPHPFHAELAILAMRAGKAVLCEKPAGMTAAQVSAMVSVAADAGVFFAEAFMYRYHPQIVRMVELIRSGEIGEVRHVRAAKGFAARLDPHSRLYDRALGGGAILDVGVYPISIARLVAGAATNRPFDNPVTLKAIGHLGETHVDEEAYALLQFESAITAECATAIRRTMVNSATIYGTKGEIHLPEPWVPGRNAGPSDAVIHVTVDGETRTEDIRRPEHLFTFEAETVSAAIRDGRREPEPPAADWADSIGNAEAIDRWRHEIGLSFRLADPAVSRRLTGLVSSTLPRVPKLDIEGIDRRVSALVMGCDNQASIEGASVIWDAWMEVGGDTFDTAFVYGAGKHEAMLGEWIAARGVAAEVTVIGKGAHTPFCTPEAIGEQLAMSLERLRLDRVPIYIMHRDNPAVPVGEFVDVLTRFHDEGRIGIFGGSNWTIERFAEANEYAAANGLQPFRILNNNLSLAVMERPVWPGCVTSNSPGTLAFLKEHQVVHFSWSSQARGYFLPEALRDRLPADTGPEACFGSQANAERRRRAVELADEFGVSAHNIATAWVLAQPFPSFALIGPRDLDEIASTLPALSVALTPAQAAWLNLELEEKREPEES
jgi:predicted dehydrogenase/aryl-alcohol dehydrogenase-like predicted oxidoreductase